MLSTLKRLFSRTAAPETPVSEAQWQTAETRLPFLSHLVPAERQRLRRLALEFIRGKSWQGVQGLVITLEMQLEIALQACLLILKRPPGEYDGWVEIVIYPGDFIIPREEMDEIGIVHEYDDTVLGEAWDGGPLLLSWQQVEYGDAFDDDGINVVIHEFAHKLDMATGEADGLPRLPDAAARRRWIAAFEPAYLDFCGRVDRGETTAIDPYAATAPAEFFAVLSEVFFEQPALLQHEYPAVYTELAHFYGQTPL
ncbi:MAG: zinc-dependent peptidase [Rhodocyclaceae bacterium]|nr:zinc-dependent peptidase [Rhodocyclaceae bacterium]